MTINRLRKKKKHPQVQNLRGALILTTMAVLTI